MKKIMCLTPDEYQSVLTARKKREAERQAVVEAKYYYSPEKQKELLAQRDLDHELRQLKKAQVAAFVGAIIAGSCLNTCLTAAFHTPEARFLGCAVTLAAYITTASRLNKKIRLKKDEKFWAARGQINPCLEALRHHERI